MKILSRHEAIKLVQEKLGNTEQAAHVIDWVQEMWETIEALHERFPEFAWMIIHAQPLRTEKPEETQQEALITLESVSFSELFAVAAAVVWYRAWLQMHNGEVAQTALQPLQTFYRRLLEVPAVPLRSGTSSEDMADESVWGKE